jgi:hypothetical protein
MQPDAVTPQWTPPDASPPPVTPSAPPPATPVDRRRISARWVNVALVAALGIAVAGVAFAVGRATAPSALDQLRSGAAGNGQFFLGQDGQGFPGQGGQNGQGGRFMFGGLGGGIAIEGTVEAIDGDSLTVKTADGRTVELSLGSDTTYHTASDASASSVTNGSKVVVRVQPGAPQESGDGVQLSADDVTVVP